MKAAIYSQAGSPGGVEIADVDEPVPLDDEVLIKVCAASINPADWRIASATPFLRGIAFKIAKAKVGRPGVDAAGVVEAIGRNVTQLKPGDQVFGAAYGAFAECARASPLKLALKPPNVTFEQAASVPIAGVTALQGLRDKGQLRPGQKVLINGAAGGVGTFAVQIAKHLGADVTGVCSTRNVDMVRSIGADRVIDYTREDFTKSGERYDLILDNVGNHSLAARARVLKPKGILVIAGAPKKGGAMFLRALDTLLTSPFVSQKAGMFLARINSAELATIAELMQAGKVTPVIDRRYSLSEVPQAMAYGAEGHSRGKVIITMDDNKA